MTVFDLRKKVRFVDTYRICMSDKTDMIFRLNMRCMFDNRLVHSFFISDGELFIYI